MICEENFDRRYEEECAFWNAKREAHRKLSEKFTAHHMYNDKSEAIDDNGKLYLGGKAKVRPASAGIWDPILQECDSPPRRSSTRTGTRGPRRRGASSTSMGTSS